MHATHVILKSSLLATAPPSSSTLVTGRPTRSVLLARLMVVVTAVQARVSTMSVQLGIVGDLGPRSEAFMKTVQLPIQIERPWEVLPCASCQV